MMVPVILVAEDEAPQLEMLRYNLQSEGFKVMSTADGEQALLLARENLPDLIVLDWMLPQLSGLDICRRLRAGGETKAIPIIMLTARGEEADRVRGLEMGADDYVVKPFSPRELVSRIRAVLRRTRPALVEETLEYGGIHMNLATHTVSRGGENIHLGPTEFRLLRTFLERPGRVFSREQLLDRVWGRDIHVEQRTVDVHIRRLRNALKAPESKDPIRTVRGAGYALDSALRAPMASGRP